MADIKSLISQIQQSLRHSIDGASQEEAEMIKKKFADFASGQIVRDADVRSSLKEQVRSKFTEVLKDALEGNSEAIDKVSEMSERHHLKKGLQKFNYWSLGSGENFLKNELKNFVKPSANLATKLPMLGTKNLAGESIILNYLQKKTGSSIFSFEAGSQSSFLVEGSQQQSSTYRFRVNAGVGTEAHSLNFYHPSSGGFISGNAPSRGGLARSAAIYTTPTDFLTNYKNGKFSAKGMDFFQFQVYQMKALESEIGKIKSNTNLSSSQIQDQVGKAVKYYQTSVDRVLNYVGNYQQMADSNSLRSNQRAKVLVTQASSVYIPGFERGPSPGDLEFFEAMEQEGIKLNLSSGQAGKIVEGYQGMTISPRGMRKEVMHYSGLDVPGYKEPHKAFGELGLLKRGPQEIQGYGGLSRFAKLLPDMEDKIKETLRKRNVLDPVAYNPEGVRLTVAFGGQINSNASNSKNQGISDEITTKIRDVNFDEFEKLEEKIGKEETLAVRQSRQALKNRQVNLFNPDGSLAVNERLFAEGSMDVVQNRSYSVSLGSTGGAEMVSPRINAIASGGEIDIDLGQFDKSLHGQRGTVGIKGYSTGTNEALEITGFNEETSEFFKKRNIDSQGFIGRKAQIDFKRGEALGLSDIGTIERVMNRENTFEILDSIHVDSKTGALKVSTFASTSTIGSDPIPHLTKIVGGHQESQIKATLDPVREDSFIEGLKAEGVNLGNEEALKRVDAYDDISRLKSAKARAYYQTGALQVGIGEALEKGVVAKEQQELLRNLVMTQTPEELIQTLMGDDLVRRLDVNKRIKGDLSKQTFMERIGTVSGLIAEESSDKAAALDLTMGRAVAPYNEWAKESGLISAIDESVEFLGDSPGTTKTHKYELPVGSASLSPEDQLKEKQHQIQRRNMYQVNRGLSEVMGNTELQQDSVNKAFRSRNSMLSNFVAGIRDEGNLLGMGQRASVEPRFFDVSLANPNLQPAMKDISSRMTNYMPVIRGISKTLSGEIPDNLDVFNLGTQTGKTMEALGKKSFVLDLNLGEDFLKEANFEHGSKIQGKIFVPGGEYFTSMGTTSLGSGLERDEELRKIYSNFMTETLDTKRRGDVKGFREAHGRFQGSLQNALKTNLLGVAGSDIGGMMRGEVEGSVVAYNRGFGGEMMRELGLRGIPERADEAMSKQRQIFSQMLSGSHADFQKPVDVGRITFLSKAAAKQSYEDLARGLENKGLADQASSVRGRLSEMMSGGYDIGSVMRDPGIGPESHGASIFMVDLASKESGSSFYSRTSQSFLNIEQASIQAPNLSQDNVAKLQSKLEKTVQVSLQQGLNSDIDGDRLKIFPMANEDAIRGLRNQVASREYNHGVRYSAMKGMAIEAIKSRSDNFKELHQRYGIGVSAPAAEAVAHAGPKQFVPFISNPLTHMKFAMASSSVGFEGKMDLFAVAEALEQVPIGTKHIATSADAAKAYQETISGINKKLWAVESSRGDVVGAAEDLFKMGFGVGEQSILPESISLRTSQGTEVINMMKIQQDFIDSVMETRQSKTKMAVIDILRNKKTIEFGMEAGFEENFFGYLRDQVSQVHGGVSEGEIADIAGSFKKGYAEHSRKAITQINQTLQSAGESVASLERGMSNLKPKHMKALGIGAGVVGAGLLGGGMILSSTWSDRSRDKQIDPDMLFPEELQQMKEPNLHNPISGLGGSEARLSSNGAYQVNLMSQGNFEPRTGISRMAAGIASMGANSVEMTFNDNRVNIDSWTLSKYKKEFY